MECSRIQQFTRGFFLATTIGILLGHQQIVFAFSTQVQRAFSSDILLQRAASSNQTILLPGVYDALSAHIFASSNQTQALFLSGFGITASLLAQPDVGLLTLTELEATTRNIINSQQNSLPVPLIVDGDTGFGGDANIRRTVQTLAMARAAAITIEDQAFPKQCTFLGQQERSSSSGGLRLVDRSESIARLRTALAAKDEIYETKGEKILIIGRTDCRSVLGYNEAVSRCQEYEEIGCDLVYAENLKSPDEYMNLRQKISSDTPMIMAQVQTGQQQAKLYSISEMTELGYDFGLWGITSLQATIKALQDITADMFDIENGGIIKSQESKLASFNEVKEVVGYPEITKSLSNSHNTKISK